MLEERKKIVKDAIIVVSVIAVVLLGIRFMLGLSIWESPFYVVSSGSMIPTLNVNDVLIVQGSNFEDVKIGDIIVFKKPNVHDKIIVHRVVQVNEVNNVRVITTKGDANPSIIPGTDYPITENDYIGRVIFVIPKLGYVTNLLPPPLNYITVVVIVLLIFVNSFYKSKKEKSNNDTKSI